MQAELQENLWYHFVNDQNLVSYAEGAINKDIFKTKSDSNTAIKNVLCIKASNSKNKIMLRHKASTFVRKIRAGWNTERKQEN